MNAGVFFLEQMAYFFRNTLGYGNVVTGILGLGSRWFCLIGYVIFFIIFHKKIKTTNNEISEGMIKIWGIVLIGGKMLAFLYLGLIPSGNNDKIITLWKCRELIEILPVIFALFMSVKEVSYGIWGGTGTLTSVSNICIKCLMIFGMIALGLYLKTGVKDYGDK